MGQVKIVAQFKAKDGKASNAKQEVQAMVAVAKRNPGVTGYEVHAHGESLLFIETYKDSAAVMASAADPSFGPAVQGLFSKVDLLSSNVLGDVSPDLKKALGEMGAKFYTPVANKA